MMFPSSKNKFLVNVSFVLLLICLPAWASFEDLGIGARQQGMGEAFVALANTSDAVFWNPAGLAGPPDFEVSTYYARPFGLKELAHNTLSLRMPVGKINAGLGIQSFGYAVYRENSYTAGIAGNFQGKLGYGINLKYLSLSIKNYGSDAAFGVDVGLLLNYSPQVAFGFVAKNVNRPTLGSQQEYLPQIFVSGFCFKPRPDLNITLDIYKDIRFPLDPRAGIEYRLFSKIYLRAGTAWEPARYSLGLGLAFFHFQIDYAFHSHPTLNLTHLLSVTFSRANTRTTVATKIETKKKTPRKPGKLQLGESININTAGLEALCRLHGIGKKTAQRIIDYRETQGPFVNLTELTEIKGIGTKKFKAILPYIRLKD